LDRRKSTAGLFCSACARWFADHVPGSKSSGTEEARDMNFQAGPEYHTALARDEFDSWSRRYDWDPLQWLFFRPSHRMMMNYLDVSDRRLLDIGCGTGKFAWRVLERFPRTQVVGLDLSDGMLRAAGPRSAAAAGRFHLVQGDSERLPFASDSFDVVTCCHSFHHYPHQEEAVAQMHRVLRPGGKLLIIDGDRDRLWGRFIYDGIVVMMEGAVKHLSGEAFRDLYDRIGFADIMQQRRKGILPFLLTVGRAQKTLAPARREAA
jgi:ubiquinone/menaquinone biosynthesis C-methylase UbiE